MKAREKLWTSGFLRRLTGDVVAQYPRRDNSAVRTEEILQILLRHVLRQAAHVQIRAFDRLAARSRVRHLEKKKRNRIPKKLFLSRSRRMLSSDCPTNKNEGINVAEILDTLSNGSKKGGGGGAHAIIIALFLLARDKIRPNPGQPIYIAALPLA